MTEMRYDIDKVYEYFISIIIHSNNNTQINILLFTWDRDFI